MQIVETGIRERLGEKTMWSSSCVDEAFPDYVVMNSYVGNASIGEHHDGDAMFHAVNKQAAP